MASLKTEGQTLEITHYCHSTIKTGQTQYLQVEDNSTGPELTDRQTRIKVRRIRFSIPPFIGGNFDKIFQ